MLTKKIGANIKAARLAKTPKVSLEKLAARIEPPTRYQTISKLENGERPITIEWVERIATALEIDPMEILAPELSAREDATARTLHLDEQVAIEAARSLAAAALGEEPSIGTVQAVASVLRRLVELFSTHPEASTDLRVARPAIDIASNRLAPGVR
jgi:transcriptional regulator with XRE-family HTH domain